MVSFSILSSISLTMATGVKLVSGFKYVVSARVLSFNSDLSSIFIPISLSLPLSKAYESDTADSFSKVLISEALKVSGYITSSIPIDL